MSQIENKHSEVNNAALRYFICIYFSAFLARQLKKGKPLKSLLLSAFWATKFTVAATLKPFKSRFKLSFFNFAALSQLNSGFSIPKFRLQKQVCGKRRKNDVLIGELKKAFSNQKSARASFSPMWHVFITNRRTVSIFTNLYIFTTLFLF